MENINLIVFYGITIIAVLISFIVNKGKTIKALKIAWKRLRKISLMMMTVIILVAVSLYFISDELILSILGNENMSFSLGAGALIGSIAMIPGFVVFPLCGLLAEKGVPYVVLASFTTTLMMVGIVSFPLERELFGLKFAVIRNTMSMVIAVIVSMVIGIVFGEILI